MTMYHVLVIEFGETKGENAKVYTISAGTVAQATERFLTIRAKEMGLKSSRDFLQKKICEGIDEQYTLFEVKRNNNGAIIAEFVSEKELGVYWPYFGWLEYVPFLERKSFYGQDAWNLFKFKNNFK